MIEAHTPVATRSVALAAASLLIASSAALSVFYAWTTGEHVGPVVAIAFAAAALGSELLKPLAVIVTLDAARTFRPITASAAALLATVAVVFSLASQLGLSTTTRGDQAAERAAVSDAVTRHAARVHRAEAELATMAPARPAAELAPMADILRATPGSNGCRGEPDGPISRRVCAEVAKLEAEMARADRRAALEAVVSSPAPAGPVTAVGAADPLATALSAYANAAGRPVSTDAVAPWLALPLIALLEVGSALGLLVARSVGRTSAKPADHAQRPRPMTGEREALSAVAAVPSLPAPMAVAQTEGDVVELCGPATGQTAPLPPVALAAEPSTGTAAKLLAELRAKGGELTVTQRGLAARLGVSAARVNHALHELAASGFLSLETSPAGTRVALA